MVNRHDYRRMLIDLHLVRADRGKVLSIETTTRCTRTTQDEE
jgi:hypothetical protein